VAPEVWAGEVSATVYRLASPSWGWASDFWTPFARSDEQAPTEASVRAGTPASGLVFLAPWNP
jgi:hypothetical protein